MTPTKVKIEATVQPKSSKTWVAILTLVVVAIVAAAGYILVFTDLKFPEQIQFKLWQENQQ